MSEPSENTASLNSDPTQKSQVNNFGDVPAQIGRYVIDRMIGSGGFGAVYLAFDSQLLRQVAIKIPRPSRHNNANFCNSFLAEARILARLDHPHIVPVYDVGTTDTLPCYIVSKFIDGHSLAHRLANLQWGWVQRAELVKSIADALHCAHLAGLVHRDVKPANVLIDSSEKSYLADFGLALSDEDYSETLRGAIVGTLMYMSPEQVRSEGHLVDGRADVFSLGALMYELLTGVRPFAASTREQVIQNILDRDVKPLRQRNQNVPRELERICLRALERRTSNRYSTAWDMAEELRGFIDMGEESRSGVAIPSSLADALASKDDSQFDLLETKASSNGLSIPRVVPKGLRAFDAGDAEFFLKLLPGPTDRHGVPESLRFWKSRIEDSNPENTFRIGVLYGPSGSGKSSLVSAGLLPLLDRRIVPISISASANDTEARLHKSLINTFPELEAENKSNDLSQLLQSLRLHGPPASERVVLIVIDQFEQWLSEHQQSEQSLLVNALRQCDGIKLKCMLLVRNDFWMSITRVMEELDAPILQNSNSAAVELFDLRHAIRVLHAFGHAYQALPERAEDLSATQQQFLKESVEELSEDGRVICLQLALYAQMMRDQVWEPKTLVQLGGVSGLGARFLEELFHGVAASPECKRFQLPAREVLRSLLPKPGSDIRGAMQSETQLAQIAAPFVKGNEFKQLMRLLVDQLRLLTTSDAFGTEVDIDSSSPAQQLRYYQLTHDYLVQSLRKWLGAKQRETIAGRASLCLEDRHAMWEVSRENRQLPGLLETLRIQLWTERGRWTASQSRMMAQAVSYYTWRFLSGSAAVAAVVVLALFAWSQFEQQNNTKTAKLLVDQLLTAQWNETPAVVSKLDTFLPLVSSDLSQIANESSVPTDRLRALVALIQANKDWTTPLLNECEHASPSVLQLISKRLASNSAACERIIDELSKTTSSRKRLSLTALLCQLHPSTQQREVATSPNALNALVDELLEASAENLDGFVDLLKPIHDSLLPVVSRAYLNTGNNSLQREAAARVVAKTGAKDQFLEFILHASHEQHFILSNSLAAQQDSLMPAVKDWLDKSLQGEALDEKSQRQQLNALMTIMRWNIFDPIVERVLSVQPDPTLRTHMLLETFQYAIPLDDLMRALRRFKDPVARQAIILAMEPYNGSVSAEERLKPVIQELLQRYRSAANNSERSAAFWTLQRWKVPLKDEPLEESVREIPKKDSERNWWISPLGHTMVVLKQDVYKNGPQAVNENRSASEKPIGVRYFAISTVEITRSQILQYDSGMEFIGNSSDDTVWPANRVWLGLAMEYCRWLSQKENNQQVFYPVGRPLTSDDSILDDRTVDKPGYRLPTEAEWEIACEAGAITPWCHGRDVLASDHFGWSASNSLGSLHPVRETMPNMFGIWDMHGNVSEWCHPSPFATASDPKASTAYAHRGGNYTSTPNKMTSRSTYYVGSKAYSFNGFRIATTISPTERFK